MSKNRDESENTIRGMKEQIEEYEELINSGKLSKDLELANNQNLQLISSLRLENDKLKKEITRGYDAENSRMVSIGNSKVSKGAEGLNYIQKRLFDFNSKLETMIHEEDTLTSRSKNKENTNENVQNQYKDEVKSLKSKLT